MTMLNKAKRIELFQDKFKVEISPSFFYYLTENGFFTMPASTIYHGNYEGGLFDHSFEVTEDLVEMTEKFGIKWQNPRSPFVVGMFHDLCKIDSYVKVIDEPGDVMMGTGEAKGEKSHWEHNDDVILKGHGEKSIILLSQFMTLTEEEILCIRFHMGAYETGDWKQFDQAIRKYETVLWTHTADMYASKVKDC